MKKTEKPGQHCGIPDIQSGPAQISLPINTAKATASASNQSGTVTGIIRDEHPVTMYPSLTSWPGSGHIEFYSKPTHTKQSQEAA
jgi:hypothetical protein